MYTKNIHKLKRIKNIEYKSDREKERERERLKLLKYNAKTIIIYHEYRRMYTCM